MFFDTSTTNVDFSHTAHICPPDGTINHWLCWLLNFHLLSRHHSGHLCSPVVSVINKHTYSLDYRNIQTLSVSGFTLKTQTWSDVTWCDVMWHDVMWRDVQVSQYHPEPTLPHTCQLVLCPSGGWDVALDQCSFRPRHGRCTAKLLSLYCWWSITKVVTINTTELMMCL